MENISHQSSALQPPQRFAVIDMLRGYALLGVVIINYTSYKGWDYDHGNNADKVLGFLATYIFFRKSALLLSLLFGYGFAVLIDSLKKKGSNIIFFFIKRMFWLFVIAFVNSCFLGGDILKSYAVLGVILLLFYRSPTRTILVTAIILLLLIPFSSGYTLYHMSNHALEISDANRLLFLSHNILDVIAYNLSDSYILQSTWPFYAIFVQHVMLCCFLWGMFFQRIHFAENIYANRKYIQRAFWISIPAFALSTYFTFLAKHINFLKIYFNFFIISFLCGVVFFSSAMILLCISGKLKYFFRAMEYFGRMTLTNYLTQNIIGFFIFSGSGLSIESSKPYWFYFMLAIVVYVIQLFISRYWLKHYYYGPVEWFWRKLGSGKKLQFKR
ncbi:MAG TPA: DUF418 domain-containing protein [Puia sp.]|jgi:uncharacterized protein|nr:DUF418 domain-containing protein [Puia sp.]